MGAFMSLKEAAFAVRDKAYAPYSKFHVGAAIRGASGAVYVGCNVENAAYPEGTCAEAGAIAAMVAAGETRLTEAFVAAGGSKLITPCGGCRQKLAEFADADVVIQMETTSGLRSEMRMDALLPGAFGADHMKDDLS